MAVWHKIKSRVFEKQNLEILSVRFFNLVVLSRFLMSYLYFILNCKSLRILNCHHFGQKTSKNDKKSSKWRNFYPKWWQFKILRLLLFSMKYEYDIRNSLRTTKFKDCNDRISRYCFSETLDLILYQTAIFSPSFEKPFEIVKGNSD